MLKFYNYDIVFSEIPDEVSLAINISNCPNFCKGCHSPWLQKNEGCILDEAVLSNLIERYGDTITCVCFMGGDKEPNEVVRLADFVYKKTSLLKTAWYSGKQQLPAYFDLSKMNYVKLGPYRPDCGSLKSKKTNQRLYKIKDNGSMEDITFKFWK